jgi:hypothetical protein
MTATTGIGVDPALLAFRWPSLAVRAFSRFMVSPGG